MWLFPTTLAATPYSHVVFNWDRGASLFLKYIWAGGKWQGFVLDSSCFQGFWMSKKTPLSIGKFSDFLFKIKMSYWLFSVTIDASRDAILTYTSQGKVLQMFIMNSNIMFIMSSNKVLISVRTRESKITVYRIWSGNTQGSLGSAAVSDRLPVLAVSCGNTQEVKTSCLNCSQQVHLFTSKHRRLPGYHHSLWRWAGLTTFCHRSGTSSWEAGDRSCQCGRWQKLLLISHWSG